MNSALCLIRGVDKVDKRTLSYIIFIFFLMGVSIELLKDLARHKRLVKAEVTNSHRLEDYNVKLGTEEAPEISIGRAAGIFTTTPAKNTVIANNTKDKKKIDKKTDVKKAENKKKKKKKKKAPINNAEEENNIAKQNTKKPQDSNSNSNLTGYSYYTTTQNPANNNTSDKKGLTAEQWEKILLGNPTPKDIQNFIQARKTLDVSEVTYFQITKLMLNDTRIEIRKHALSLLTSAPSVNSFELMAESFFHEPANSEFRSEIEKNILPYTRLEYFGFLAGGLSRENTSAVNTVALDTLEKAIVYYRPQITALLSQPNPTPNTPQQPTTPPLAPTTATNSTGSGSTPNRTSLTLKQITTGFSRFQSPLKTLATEKDPRVSRRAGELLTQITLITSLNNNQNPQVISSNP